MAHLAEFKLQGLDIFRGLSTAQPEALARCLHHEGRNAAGANTPNSNIHEAYPTFLLRRSRVNPNKKPKKSTVPHTPALVTETRHREPKKGVRA